MKDEEITTIYECLEEIVSCLCYQPEIPLKHKTDMVNKLQEISKAYYGEKKAQLDDPH